MEKTVDPTVSIIERGIKDGQPFIIYKSVDGEQWMIYGTCSACGECEVGAVGRDLIWTGKPIGTPMACLDIEFGKRLDIPVRPELTTKMHNCSLRGKYL